MTKEEILENISDADLELAINEIRDIELEKIKFDETMMLCEIYSSLDEIGFSKKGINYAELCLICMTEFSYRKAGLK